MNYLRIYKEIMLDTKKQNRKKGGERYFEKHHIIPDFMFKNRKRKGPPGTLSGDPGAPENLILLTPREHLLSHILLHRIHRGTRYEYSCGSALAFFFSKVLNEHPRFNKFQGYPKKYERYRIAGLKAISNARKGTMPCKDAKTGALLGSFPTDHPMILSGKWVHHSKGVPLTEEHKNNLPCQKGKNNTNFKELPIELVFSIIGRCELVDGHIKYKRFLDLLNQETKASVVLIKNKFGTFSELIGLYNKANKTNIKYDPYYKGHTKYPSLRAKVSCT